MASVYTPEVVYHMYFNACHTFNLCKVQSMDDNCGEWVECMGVASGCGEQEVGVASGSGWNLMGVATGCGFKDIYISSYYLSLLLLYVSVLFCSSIPTFLFIL